MLKFNTDKIKVLMQYKYMTAADLSRETGISPIPISRLITGKTAPRSASLKKICTALDCEPQDVLQDPEQ